MRNSTFVDDFTVAVDRLHVHFDNIIVVGDLNYDLTHLPNLNLYDLCVIYSISVMS